MVGAITKVREVFRGKGVQAGGAVCCAGASGFKASAVNGVEVEGGVKVDVVGVVAAKVGDQSVCVVVVSVVDCLPDL